MSDSYDRMKQQKDVLTKNADFLRQRRGELVIERDRALTALKEMVECFDSQGPWPHDAEEGCVRMERALADAKAALSLHHMLPKQASAPEAK